MCRTNPALGYQPVADLDSEYVRHGNGGMTGGPTGRGQS